MPVSTSSSRVVYDALKATGVRLISALPETWLVHLIRMAEDDPEMTLVRLAKEEEGVGISAGAHLAGVKSAMLMQNHGFLASINGIVSCAQLYRIPLLMLISHRGEFGERDPWQTEGGGVTEELLRALRIPVRVSRSTRRTSAGRIAQGADARASRRTSRSRCCSARDLMWEEASMTRARRARARSTRELERRGRRHDHGRGRGGAAVDRPPAELLLSAARDGAGLVDGARHRAVAARSARSSCSTATARC